MDESYNLTNTAQLFIFIRGIDATFTVHEELGRLCSLKHNTAGEDLFLKVQETFAALELSWKKLKSVTTNVGKKVCDSKTVAVGRICKDVMHVGSESPMVFHCNIHQEVLRCQIFSLKDVMDIVISTVNYIQRNGLTHRQFQHFLEEIETQYGDVYYSAVRWLSRGAVLKRFFHLLSEIDIFMTEKGENVPQLSDDKWTLELAFLVDITTYLFELNVKLQGTGKLPSDMFSDVKVFEMKLKWLHKHINEQNLDHFLFLQNCSGI
jgi:hypothetical protein